jgi:hypothetical protein
MSQARRGTLISPIGFNGNNSDDDNYGAQGGNDQEKMRLYDCGHAFHIECIKKYINERN